MTATSTDTVKIPRPKRSVLPVRTNDADIKRIEELAETAQVDRSEMARRVITAGLAVITAGR